MSKAIIDFGAYLQQLRAEHNFPQKKVADKLKIDISLLSKIEHGERQVQGYMLKGIAELFDIEFRDLQVRFLNQKIKHELGNEPFLKESLEIYLKEIKKTERITD